jgi:hypothetical protein
MRHILHAHGVREVFKVHDSLQMAYRTGAPTLSVSDATKLLKYCSEHIFCEDYAPPAKTGDSGIHDSIAATDQAGAIYRCPLCPSTFHPARTYNEFLAHMNLIHHVERVDFTGTLWSPTITMAKGYELSEDNLVKLRRFFRALRKRATFAERYGLSSNELRELLFNDKVSRVADSAGTGRIAITEDESRPRAVTPRIRLYEAAKDYVRATGQEVDMKLSWPDEDGATHTAIHHFARRKKD